MDHRAFDFCGFDFDVSGFVADEGLALKAREGIDDPIRSQASRKCPLALICSLLPK